MTGGATKRVFNFNAGPAALPLSVLERIRDELLDYHGSGMSVMEMSHRSPEFEAINNAAEKRLRNLLRIPDDYAPPDNGAHCSPGTLEGEHVVDASP